MRSTFSLAILAAILIGGCSEPQTAPVGPTSITPLAVGNQWIGEIYQHIDSANTDQQLWIDTMTITGTVMLNSEQWYIVRHQGLANAFDDSAQLELLANRADGLYERQMRTDTNVLGAPYRIAIYPGQVGDTTGTQTIGSLNSTDSVGIAYDRLMSKSSDVFVPAGRFTAYSQETFLAYDSSGRTPSTTGNTAWYVPGLGLVRSVQHVTFGLVYSAHGFLAVPGEVANNNRLGYRLLEYHLQ